MRLLALSYDSFALVEHRISDSRYQPHYKASCELIQQSALHSQG